MGIIGSGISMELIKCLAKQSFSNRQTIDKFEFYGGY